MEDRQDTMIPREAEETPRLEGLGVMKRKILLTGHNL